MHVLITGFGPFPGAPSNPSARLATALARSRRPALADMRRTTHIFATTYAAVDRDLPRLLTLKPDIILMFGLAGRTPYLRVETQARNAMSLLFPDAGGCRPQRRRISKAAPAVQRGAAPFPHLLGALRKSALPARLSRDAGTYLCNYAYWRALERTNGATLVQFIHIPRIGGKRPRMNKDRRRAINFPRLVAGAEQLLIALAAASRR
jgi:pyroglutamyl-peptidase